MPILALPTSRPWSICAIHRQLLRNRVERCAGISARRCAPAFPARCCFAPTAKPSRPADGRIEVVLFADTFNRIYEDGKNLDAAHASAVLVDGGYRVHIP